MFVTVGRYNDMRDRAEQAEKRIDSLVEALANARSNTRQMQQIEIRPPVLPAKEEDLYELPPPVEEAIRKRATPGSQIEAELVEAARTAMGTLGRDFDADAYAEHIHTGTRVRGWPL